MATDEQPRKPRVNFTAPPGFYDELMAAAKSDGWDEAQIHRHCWYEGGQIYLTKRNERISQKLKQRQSSMTNAAQDLRQAIKNEDPTRALAALDIIEKGLAD